jgi:hypothetical protein
MKASLVVAAIAAALPLAALAGDQVDTTPDFTMMMNQSQQIQSDSELVRKIHDATKKYKDIRQALVKDNQDEINNQPDPKKRDPWLVGTPCVSGPDHGAMGIHVLKLGRMKSTDNPLPIDSPTALIYEPQSDGKLVLVGLEYIRDAATWQNKNGKTSVPALDGHLMNFAGAPNRYGLDPFFEIHVWAFEGNPQGAFADWNNHVTCERQPLNFTVKP